MRLACYQFFGGVDYGGVIAEAGEPMDEGFFAEPGDLALGVAARRLRNGLRGGSEGYCALDVRLQFAVADEIEWL